MRIEVKLLTLTTLLALGACGGNVVVDGKSGSAGGGSSGSSGSGASSGSGPGLPNPWQVPGPCTYTCGYTACPTPCAPGQTGDVDPYVCCDASGACDTPKDPPPGITASCPLCPDGWTPSADDLLFCCDALAQICYSPATGAVQVFISASGPTCSGGDSTCGCKLKSIDGHAYELACAAQGCACLKDGQSVKTLPDLCPAAPQALPTNYLLWACGFPPV